MKLLGYLRKRINFYHILQHDHDARLSKHNVVINDLFKDPDDEDDYRSRRSLTAFTSVENSSSMTCFFFKSSQTITIKVINR